MTRPPLDITDVRIVLARRPDSGCVAFASFTVSGVLAVKDVRIVANGDKLFCAMPAKPITDKCPGCRAKNPITAGFCNGCGDALPPLPPTPAGERHRTHTGILFPVNRATREHVEAAILAEYHREAEAARSPGYVPRFTVA